MKVSELITQAQIIAGVQSFQGNAVDVNLMRTCLAQFHQAMNQINNDPQITLAQESCDYQSASDALNPDKFDGGLQPFPISRSYPLPKDCRRVLKAMFRSMELQKTDFSEIMRGRTVPSWVNMFAVNNDSVELIQAAPLLITYAKQFPMYMPGDRLDLPAMALDYLINLTAYNIALALNKESARSCQVLANKSYATLSSNLRVNIGDVYISQFDTHAKFHNWGRFGGGMW